MSVKPTKPSDFTGSQRAATAEKAAEEQAERAKQMSMAKQVAVEANENDVFDPGTGQSLGRADSVKVDVQKEVIIRVVEDVDDMTFGYGNNYTFKVGQKYKVSETLAQHLDSLGLVWGGM